MPILRFLSLIVFALFLSVLTSAQDQAGLMPMFSENTRYTDPDFVINSTVDSIDTNPGDGQCADALGRCTLRAAIIEANALPYVQNIYVPTGNYTLTIPGSDEDESYTGDLDIREEVYMYGEGPGLTIIDANGLDRVFHFNIGVSYRDTYSRSSQYHEISQLYWLDIRGGYAPYGGGIYNELGGLILSHSQLSDNTGYGTHLCTNASGAAVFAADTTVINKSRIIQNVTPIASQTANYGVLATTYVTVDGGVRLYQTDVSNNQADWAVIIGDNTCEDKIGSGGSSIVSSLIADNTGGAVVLSASNLLIKTSTITGNNQGILVKTPDFQINPAVLQLEFVTIADNNTYGIRLQSGITTSLDHSIIAEHVTDCDFTSSMTLVGEFNVFGDASCASDTLLPDHNIDPLLAPLADNGGPTRTRALLPGSPALDLGSIEPCSDQRGGYYYGICDSGAYQSNASLQNDLPHAKFHGGFLRGSSSNSFIDRIFVQFTNEMYNPEGDTDPQDATNPANYFLLQPGANGDFDKLTCAHSVGDDILIPIRNVTYRKALFLPAVIYLYYDSANVVELELDDTLYPNGFPIGQYRLLVCDTLQDVDANPLDGNRDGVPGDDARFTFNNGEYPSSTSVELRAYYSDLPVNDYDVVLPDMSLNRPVDFLMLKALPLTFNPMSSEAIVNYRFVADGPDTQFDTQDCNVIGGDDIEIVIDRIESGAYLYDGYPSQPPIPYIYGADTSTVRILTAQPITPDDYRFIACDSMTDLELRPIDGDSDGIPGGHFVRDFSLVDGLRTPFPPILNDMTTSTIALNLPQVDGPSGAEIQIERSGNGNTSLVGSVNVATPTFVDSNLACDTEYSYRLRLYQASENRFTEYSIPLVVRTLVCNQALTHTFGLYKEGTWLFYEVNGNQRQDIRFDFGPDEAGWIALVGDWNGDGLEGIGLYKDGTFILRSVTATGVDDLQFTIPIVPPGGHPIAGDWDGDGIDTVGFGVDIVFYLKNSNDDGDIDQIIHLSGTTNGFERYTDNLQPLVGNWTADPEDELGIYAGSHYYLQEVTYDPIYDFAPPGWDIIVGDWNDDGIETLGAYNNGIWRFTNTMPSTTIDYGFNYGDLTGGWQPLSFNGDISILNRLFATTVPIPRVPIIPGPELPFAPTEGAPDSQPPSLDEVPIESTSISTPTSTASFNVTPQAALDVTSTMFQSEIIPTATWLPSPTPKEK